MPADLPVDDDAGLRQEVAERADDALGEEDREQRQRPEDRAAVDDHEQHEDEQGGGVEQGRVDPVEDAARVRREPRRPGHLRLEARRGPVFDGAPDPLDGGDEDVFVAAGSDRDADDRGFPVPRPRSR